MPGRQYCLASFASRELLRQKWLADGELAVEVCPVAQLLAIVVVAHIAEVAVTRIKHVCIIAKYPLLNIYKFDLNSKFIYII